MAVQIKPLKAFEGDLNDENVSSQWRDWLSTYDNYRIACDLNIEALPEHRKVALLIAMAGDKIHKVYEPLKQEQDTLRDVIDKITTQFAPLVNIEYLVYKFRKIDWFENEDVDSFVKRLREASVGCEFNINLDSEIIQMLICKCPNEALQQMLMTSNNRTLQHLIGLCRQTASIKKQIQDMKQVQGFQVNALRTNKDQGDQNRARGRRESQRECGRCGRIHEASVNTCPAYNKKCRNCGKLGHFESKCLNKRRHSSEGRRNPSRSLESRERRQRLNQIEVLENEQHYENESRFRYDDIFFYALTAGANFEATPKLDYRDVVIQDSIVNVLVDSGSPVNIIDEQTFQSLTTKPVKYQTNKRLFGYGSKIPIDTIGAFRSDIRFSSTKVNTEFIVVKGKHGNILSHDTAIMLNLFKNTGSQYVRINRIEDTLKKHYASAFEPRIGELKNYEVKLSVNKNVELVCQTYRPVPFHQRLAVETELSRMLENNIIEPAEGKTTWCSAMVIVPKSDGKVRICSDDRPLKQALYRERHPLPTIADLKYKVNGAKHFSKIDMRAGYYQLKLNKQSRQYTTFATHLGLY